MALPLLDMRAVTITLGKPDSFICGAIAWLSSSAKRNGRSFTCLRTTASGMRGPSTARATTNTVSCGAGTGRERGGQAHLTADRLGSGRLGSTGFSDLGAGLAAPAAGAFIPAAWRAWARPVFSAWASSESAGTCASSRSQ